MDILNERYLIRNSTRFDYYEIKTDLGTDLNATNTYYIISESIGRWEIPCLSYLDVEGQLVNTDGTTYVKDIYGDYPDVTIANNFFPFLFNNIKYKIDTVDVETLDNPGILTTVNSLLTYQRAFNGLDMGWALDTGDGHMPIAFKNVPTYTPDTFVMANTTKANYTMVVKRLAPYVTSYNPCDFEIHDIDITCPLDAGPSRENIRDTFNTIITTRVNNILGVYIQPFVLADIPAGAVTVDNIRTVINIFITRFNGSAPFNIQLSNVLFNEGSNRRKNLLFNRIGNIMDPADAGKFKFRIPLDHLFNFCKFYRNGIYNARHELRFTRQSDFMSVSRHENTTLTDGKIRLDRIKWMMPQVTLNPELSLRVKENFTVPVEFVTKHLRKHPVVAGVSNFPVTYTLPNVNSVRYIIVLFQIRDLTVYPDSQAFNYAIFNNPYNSRENIIDISNITAKVGWQSFYIGEYSNNNLGINHGSSYYNEFKRIRQDYLNDYRDTDMISYDEFINLYRMYCINVSCHEKELIGTSADIELQITFNSPVPPVTAAEIDLYTVTYYDTDWKFKYDGNKHVLFK